MHRNIILLSLSACLLSGVAAAQNSDFNVREAELRAHVEFLASPELEGRSALDRGSRVAERYIATRFEQYGLEAVDSISGYYQTVPLVVQKTDYDNTRLIIDRDVIKSELKPMRDFYFFPRSGQDRDMSGSLLLCGYGIRAEEYRYDDFRGSDPKGKVLLVFSGEPQDSSGKSLLTEGRASKYSRAVVKARLAQELGAAAVLVMQPPLGDHPPMEQAVGRYLADADEPLVQLPDDTGGVPIFYLKRSAAEALLGRDFDLEGYQNGIDQSLKGDPRLSADIIVTLRIRFKDVRQQETANIIGILPGKSDEAVLLTAHHDHEGIKDGQIYFGADDNASGVAGLLGVARALSERSEPLSRTVIFLSPGAEEKGSLGARYFVEHPLYPLEKIVAEINMDEIGRDGSPQFRAMMDPSIPGEKDLLMMFYSGQSPVLADIAKMLDGQHLNLMLEPVLTFHSGSDHVVFHQKGIPSVFLFTGFHSDYTSPTDTPDKIVYNKLTRVTRFAAELATALAERPERPTFDRSIRQVERKGEYGN